MALVTLERDVGMTTWPSTGSQVRPKPIKTRGGPSPSTRHSAPLDGIRALAVAAVMAVHAGTPFLPLGWLGVDLFFVLSGFLITTLLVREVEASGRVDLGRFWGRRFLRLMPAYWLYASFLTVVILVVPWGWVKADGDWTPAAYVLSIWTYFVNYSPPYGTIWEHQEFSVLLWSLAVEEQFYFLWPVAFSLLYKTGWLPRVAWGLVAWILVHRLQAESWIVRVRLDTRGLGILFGSALALNLAAGIGPRMRAFLDSTRARFGVVAAILAVIAVGSALQITGRVNEVWPYRWVVPVVVPLFASLVAMLWYGRGDVLSKALSWRPLVYVGKISYGMYLYHMATHHLTWDVLTPGLAGMARLPKFGLRMTLYFALTTLIASLSYHLLEKRFLVLKARLH